MIVSTVHPLYVTQYAAKHSGLADKPYQEQLTAWYADFYAWSNAWTRALEPYGYEVMTIVPNAHDLQRAWAKEYGLDEHEDIRYIAVAQARQFLPDIVWYNTGDSVLIDMMIEAVPSVRISLGWVGSTLENIAFLRGIDLVLSCAPESVARLRAVGFVAEHLDHAFDTTITAWLQERQPCHECVFVGDIVRNGEYHLLREQCLEQLVGSIPLEIFSPSAALGWRAELWTLMQTAGYETVRGLKRMGVSESTVSKIPLVGRAAGWHARPLIPVSRCLKPHIKPAMFGREMYQLLRDAKITLNIHADSSPLYASNMRLFEATGVGTCLLTDAKKNLDTLFAPDTEVVVFSSPDECREKVRWLLDHPEERKRIAAAGMRRAHADHTFYRRAEELDAIIRRFLVSRQGV
jgi:glycosyltransferase involved in cell wall biosynthesis